MQRAELERLARNVLAELDLPDAYVDWTMVVLGSAVWRPRVASVPFDRRLLLLPHCMHHSQTCPAEYDKFGLKCEGCGACPLHELKTRAESLGCHVLIAEGSPIVLQLILSGQADAVLGVGCLDSLEKSFDKLTAVGIPGMAVPLFSCNCKDTTTDLEAVRDMIDTPYREDVVAASPWLSLLRASHDLFQPEELLRLVPPVRGEAVREYLPSWDGGAGESEAGESDASVDLDNVDPIAATELLAYDFLLQGGKHFRPFITLASYDAMADIQGDMDRCPTALVPDSVKRVAIAIEVFHKASLVHDDIEDDDAYRYGRPTLHTAHGTATAINVGDYLIGLGYRLAASQHAHLPSDAIADIVARLGLAHTKLSEGQGAELAWRDAKDKRLSPLEALKIYALKTSPAFEVALYAGLRLAGPARACDEAIVRFSRQLGVAFQIQNDLKDWTPDEKNKCVRGGDILGGRPTVLLALALETLDADEQQELLTLLNEQEASADSVDRVLALYEKANVRASASRLVVKHAARAREVADSVALPRLKELLHYFVDTIIC